MKLYSFYEYYGRSGSIEGLLILTDEEYNKLTSFKGGIYWNELLGKHSEGHHTFDEETLSDLGIPEDVVKILYDKIGSVVSGPFDLDHIWEQVDEWEAEQQSDEEEE